MVVQFYTFSLSPNCYPVYMVFKALNLDYEEKVINLQTGEQKKPEYLSVNPRGKVPSVKDGDYTIAESRAIAAYLCNQYETGDDSSRLYPVEAKPRGLVDERFYDSILAFKTFEEYMNTYGVIFRGEKPRDEKIPDVNAVLDIFERIFANSEYAAGNHVTLADIFLSSPMLMLAGSDYQGFKDHPKTASWLAKVKSLPYFEECFQEKLGKLIETYQIHLASTMA